MKRLKYIGNQNLHFFQNGYHKILKKNDEIKVSEEEYKDKFQYEEEFVLFEIEEEK